MISNIEPSLHKMGHKWLSLHHKDEGIVCTASSYHYEILTISLNIPTFNSFHFWTQNFSRKIWKEMISSETYKVVLKQILCEIWLHSTGSRYAVAGYKRELNIVIP
jgi:hypothetical protein